MPKFFLEFAKSLVSLFESTAATTSQECIVMLFEIILLRKSLIQDPRPSPPPGSLAPVANYYYRTKKSLLTRAKMTLEYCTHKRPFDAQAKNPTL